MKGPTKPGWYWVIFRDGDEWVIDRANLNATTGELWWWAYGGRVADREVVALERLEPPSKAGAKPKALPDDPKLHDHSDGTYIDPPNPSGRSFLAKSPKPEKNSECGTRHKGTAQRGGDVRSTAEPTRGADSEPAAGRSGDTSAPAVPSGVFRLYGQRVIVTGVAKRGRGFSYSVANEATPKRTRFVPVTTWGKEAKPA